MPVWTSSSDGHKLSLFFPTKVADKRQGIQVADRVTCKCLSWAIYLSAFLVKRGDVCHSCQLCVIFPLRLSSSFIPWMEVLFDFLFLARFAGGAPLSRCPNASRECATLAGSRDGEMKNRTENASTPPSFNRHSGVRRGEFPHCSAGEQTQSLPFGPLQSTEHHTRSRAKYTRLSFYSLGDSSSPQQVWKQGISKLLLFNRGVDSIIDKSSFQVWHGKISAAAPLPHFSLAEAT